MATRYYAAGLEALGDREVGFCASTPELARDGHILVPAGIDLSNYRQNPIMLWGHDPEKPVATATAIGLQGNNLIGRAEFAPAGASKHADEVCALVKSGVVRGVSIGFDPIDYEPLDPREPWGGQRILSSELLEISFVSIPADTGAAVIARSYSSAARFVRAVRQLPRLPARSIDRAMVRVRSARPSAPIISPTLHVWSLQQIELEKEKSFSLAERQAELRGFRDIAKLHGEPQRDPWALNGRGNTKSRASQS